MKTINPDKNNRQTNTVIKCFTKIDHKHISNIRINHEKYILAADVFESFHNSIFLMQTQSYSIGNNLNEPLMDFYSPIHRQDRTIESDCAAVCNQFSVAHVLSHLSEYERQRFLLFIQHNVDTAGK